MSKVALTPDLMRDIRDIQKRLSDVEGRVSGPRFYGPYTTGAVALGSGAASTAIWTHNLALGPVYYGALAWVDLASGPVPRWAVFGRSANTITFSIDLTSVSGASNFALVGYVLIT